MLAVEHREVRTQNELSPLGTQRPPRISSIIRLTRALLRGLLGTWRLSRSLAIVGHMVMSCPGHVGQPGRGGARGRCSDTVDVGLVGCGWHRGHGASSTDAPADPCTGQRASLCCAPVDPWNPWLEETRDGRHGGLTTGCSTVNPADGARLSATSMAAKVVTLLWLGTGALPPWVASAARELRRTQTVLCAFPTAPGRETSMADVRPAEERRSPHHITWRRG